MFSKLEFACMEIDNENGEVFAVYQSADCQREKGFALDFSSIEAAQAVRSR